MIEKTLIVVGPGGVGKSPLDALFKTDIKIDPYRLRSSGPRDSNDIFYAHPKLRDELHSVLKDLGDEQETKDGVEWFPKSKVLFFKVRKEWQFLIFKGLKGKFAKAEIYAPVLPAILSISDIKSLLGEVRIVVLNPVSQSVKVMQDWVELKKKTEYNCKQRGDDPKTVKKRVESVDEEAPAWKELIKNHGAVEYCNWQFPEYLYKEHDLVEHQKQVLLQARQYLLKANLDLEVFFKSVNEIGQIREPFVK